MSDQKREKSGYGLRLINIQKKLPEHRREYRTEFHIGLAYGISESAVCRTIKKIENALIKSEQFYLPNKKALQSDSMNRALSRKRIAIEHIFRKFKVFRILSERYRNRKKRFGLRFSLIAAVYNMELKIACG